MVLSTSLLMVAAARRVCVGAEGDDQQGHGEHGDEGADEHEEEQHDEHRTMAASAPTSSS